MMKLTLLLFIIMASISLAQTYMNIHNKDGTSLSFDIQEIQKLTFSDVTSIEETNILNTVVKSFTLLQNYPNPFNPSTTIQYSIPKSGNVQIRIFNINGELIRSIADRFLEAGTHEFKWDSKNDNGQKVSSGVYIYQVKYNDTFLSKKLLLIK